MGFSDKLDMISLGQGQGPKAAKLIEHGMKEGTWVVLQNCHLCQSWMPTLERTVEGFEDNKHINKAFRLFLTSMPAPYFPVPVLQNGVKLTTEPPNGIRANLKRSLLSKSDESLESCSQPAEWRTLQLSLMFFHSIVQERRKFGPLGWNIRYEFNDSDLETSYKTLRKFLDDQDELPWDALDYVTGAINYGGRVTDDWDRRCLYTVLRVFVDRKTLNDDHRFSTSGVYYVPPVGTLDDAKEYLLSMPVVDGLDIFGMHQNAYVTYQMNSGKTLMTTILGLQPRDTGGGGGKSSDEIVVEIIDATEPQVPLNLDRY